MCAKYYDLKMLQKSPYQSRRVLLDTAAKFALFSVTGLKDEKLIKSKPTWKLKHANSILESFEHLSQISSKSILRISRYTVPKLVLFLETVVSEPKGLVYRVLLGPAFRQLKRFSSHCSQQQPGFGSIWTGAVGVSRHLFTVRVPSSHLSGRSITTWTYLTYLYLWCYGLQ